MLVVALALAVLCVVLTCGWVGAERAYRRADARYEEADARYQRADERYRRVVGEEP